MANLLQQFDALVKNMTSSMYEDLAKQLHVPVTTLQELGVGFYPAKQVFVFAERDGGGKVCGLVFRTFDGGKYMHKGSKRGLTYLPTAYVDSPTTKGVRWVRCSPTTGIICPICGRDKWCMVSSDNVNDPQAVMCTKVEEGSDSSYVNDEMFLHIRKQGGRITGSLSLLHPSEYPILIVEGQTDVLAAMSLGFVAIGKPSALGGGRMLLAMVEHRDVIIIGENDGGDGKKGMESTQHVLKDCCTDLKAIMPPEGVKDLRQWITRAKLTRDDLLEYTEKYGVSDNKLTYIFDDDNAAEFTDRWLREDFIKPEGLVLRRHDGMFWLWDSVRYRQQPLEMVANTVWKFAGKCSLAVASQRTITNKKYPMTKGRLSSILSAASARTAVTGYTPQWLDNEHNDIDPINVVSFKNGLLDVSSWILYPPSPEFFSYNGLPFDYVPDIDYSWWEDLVGDIMQHDEDSIRLLQQWFGYCLIPDCSQEKLMIFIGQPRSGKGTMLHALESILGVDQVAAASLASLAGRFGYEPLVGKLAVAVGDSVLPRGASPRAALEKLLSIVGQDGVTVDRKGLPAVENVRLHCRFTVATNFALALQDRAGALTPRLNILEFGNSYAGREDRSLKRTIAKNGQAIATWALLGLDDLRSTGCFIDPRKSNDRKKEMAYCNSPLRHFIHACCLTGEEYMTTWDAFRVAYRNWVRDQGFPTSNSSDIKQELKMICREVKFGRQPQADTTVGVCIGIELTPSTIKLYLED